MHEGVFPLPPRKKSRDERDRARFLCPESRRRAGRHVAFLLARVAPTATGGDGPGAEDVPMRETGRRGGETALAWRAREGARATFRWLEPALENEALLEDGAWIENAVAAAVLL